MNLPFIQKVLILNLLLFVTSNSLAQKPFNCTGNIYLSVVDENEQVQLYDLFENRSSVDFVPFNTINDLNINAIGYRRTDNFIYGIDPIAHFLYRIDATGIAEQLAYIVLEENYFAGDITPDGQYLVLFNGTSIAKINLDNINAPPIYMLVQLSEEQAGISCTDIAFHPQNGVLFGYDGFAGRLITIDIETGLVDNYSFETIDYNNTIPALFFNVIGELKGIATNNLTQEAILFQFDLETGRAQRSLSPDLIGDRDACSCPYILHLEANFSASMAFPCTMVDYTIKIGNFGGEPQSNAHLNIEFPLDFEINAVLHNPFSSNQLMTEDANVFVLQDMDIPEGVDSIVLQLAIPQTANGLYQVQAALETIGALSGTDQQLLSDNPYTFEANDPSTIEIVGLVAATDLGYPDNMELCAADSILLDFPNIEGLQYQWNTGDTSSYLSIVESGIYRLQITSLCDSTVYEVEVWDTDIQLSLGADMEQDYKDNFVIIPEITSTNPIVEYQWTNESEIPVICGECPFVNLEAIRDETFHLTVTNTTGCTARDSIQIQVNRPIYAPTAFSPNDDGINDLFYLQSIHPPIQVLSFQVFDRWGAKRHEASGRTNDPSMAWTGKQQQRRLASGVYVWTAVLEYPNGKQVQLSGDVLLLR